MKSQFFSNGFYNYEIVDVKFKILKLNPLLHIAHAELY